MSALQVIELSSAYQSYLSGLLSYLRVISWNFDTKEYIIDTPAEHLYADLSEIFQAKYTNTKQDNREIHRF